MEEDKLMELFYEFPNKKFSVREISRKIKISKSAVQGRLEKLRKEGMLNKDKTPKNTDFFNIKKINYYTEKIMASGVIEHIKKEMSPSCIILFGSFRKGESVKESDIDLFAESAKKKPDLSEFEKKLGHKIELFVNSDANKMPKELFNNIINGIKLYGYIKIK